MKIKNVLQEIKKGNTEVITDEHLTDYKGMIMQSLIPTLERILIEKALQGDIQAINCIIQNYSPEEKKTKH